MLSLSMIVKNEGKYLRDCLASVEGTADEIVVIDTGSTDDTLDIAREYNAKIFQFDWIDDFSAARNYALSKTTGDWVLYLDADERLSAGSKEEINKIKLRKGKEGVRCIVNSIDEQKGQPQIMRYVRLFAKSQEIGFSGCVHEQIEESLLKNDYKIFNSEIEIIHIGYNIPDAEIKEKAKRNLNLLLNEYSKKHSSYYAFQLANAYAILDEKENACRHYKLSAEDKSLAKEYRTYSYMNIADYELYKGNLEEAEKSLLEGLRIDANDIMLNLIASQYYLRLNKLNEALRSCKKAYEQNYKLMNKKEYSNVFNVSVNPVKIIYNGLYLSYLKQNKEGFSYFYNELKKNGTGVSEKQNSQELGLINNLLNNENAYPDEILKYADSVTANNLAFILTLLKSFKNKAIALQILEKIKKNFGGDTKFLSSYGLALYDNGKYELAEEALTKGINAKEKDPAAYFYLISLYVDRQKYELIKNIITLAETEFRNIPEVFGRINLIKGTLAPLFE
jgi:glycosyltransferase involved in cell wall biosynthesis